MESNTEIKQERKREKLYAPHQVSSILNIENDLLRKWVEHFNVQTEWTQEHGKGHRRYTEENISELQAIKEKLQENKWSWNQVLSWRNGEEDAFLKHEEKSNLEKKMDKILVEMENLREENEQQRQFNQILVERLDKMNNTLSENITHKIEMEDKGKGEAKEETKSFWDLFNLKKRK